MRSVPGVGATVGVAVGPTVGVGVGVTGVGVDVGLAVGVAVGAGVAVGSAPIRSSISMASTQTQSPADWALRVPVTSIFSVWVPIGRLPLEYRGWFACVGAR